ncbi:MAG: N-formylglutamate amidohydrolase [Opitutales bacterium]|nr:N-formylglutamate amidohydrolase [Opitutales bacterium]
MPAPATQTTPPLVLSCEHATSEVPPAYRDRFAGADDILRSHRGWDPGAYDAALAFRDRFRAPLIAGEATRLLVELNRSLDHARLWSEFTGGLTWVEKERILRRYYRPYRAQIADALRAALAEHPCVLHLSVHSLTPDLDGNRRDHEIALLFDPARPRETALCEAWAAALGRRNDPPRIVFNEPYKGSDDGLTTALRTRFPADRYLGVEIEFNQRDVAGPPAAWRRIVRRSVETLEEALAQTAAAPRAAR